MFLLAYSPPSLSVRAAVERLIRVTEAALSSETKSLVIFADSFNQKWQKTVFGCICLVSFAKDLLLRERHLFVFDISRFHQLFATLGVHSNDALELLLRNSDYFETLYWL